MIIKTAELETVAGVTTKGLPQTGRPEFAFAGRSNVGKSSLINSIAKRKALARTSGTPGKTQTMNFYNINNELTLTDLPGYGYAKVDQDFKKKWGKMIEKYLTGSKTLKAIILLVDIRHKPTADDVDMYEWIGSMNFGCAVVATKLDKLKRSEVKKALELIKNTLQLRKEDVLIPFSAKTGAGRDEVCGFIEQILEEERS
ncbi:MAG: YihA family ribosome biogenesis GTP-binding protein [Lachnospiraceae bacterium]|nr:YihA family ribosome biogenesis GTP-binding protein [Lachnospiraceae bacterium]